jgi:exodeoxyribonuclease VII large subunit
VQRAARASQGLVAATPDVARLRSRIDALGDRLPRAQHARLAAWTATVQRAQDSLRHLDPTAVLERGYAIVRDAQGRVVRRAASLRIGESVDIAVGEGAITADVTALREG